MRVAVGKLDRDAPGRRRNRSQIEIAMGLEGFNSRSPTFEKNPRAWPISCVAVASKSTLSASMPFEGSKSNGKFELKPTEGGGPNLDSATGSATGGNSPRARKIGLDVTTEEVEPMSVCTDDGGSMLTIALSS